MIPKREEEEDTIFYQEIPPDDKPNVVTEDEAEDKKFVHPPPPTATLYIDPATGGKFKREPTAANDEGEDDKGVKREQKQKQEDVEIVTLDDD